jgi:hypothetical protein
MDKRKVTTIALHVVEVGAKWGACCIIGEFGMKPAIEGIRSWEKNRVTTDLKKEIDVIQSKEKVGYTGDAVAVKSTYTYDGVEHTTTGMKFLSAQAIKQEKLQTIQNTNKDKLFLDTPIAIGGGALLFGTMALMFVAMNKTQKKLNEYIDNAADFLVTKEDQIADWWHKKFDRKSAPDAP